MATSLTQEHFDETITKLLGIVATRDELQGLRHELEGIKQEVGHLQSSVDAFASSYRKDADERAVLAGRVDRIKRTLVKKGVAREQELAV